MACSGEKVEGGDGRAGVAEGGEPLDVAGESCGVAGNVNDALGGEADNVVDEFGGASRAGRVEYYDVGRDLFAKVAFSSVEQALAVGGITRVEFCIGFAVCGGILARTKDSRVDDLDADKLTAFVCHRKTDRSGTAIKVEQGVGRGGLGKLLCLCIKQVGSRAVYLVE